MRALIQRVTSASVYVDDSSVGEIGIGLLVLIGIKNGDKETDVEYVVDKTTNLRIFPDNEGKFDKSVSDVGGSVLLVSQFTLYSNTRKGRRPSFTEAMPPEEAKDMFDAVTKAFEDTGVSVQRGIFRSQMQVNLVNDGPVTIMIDSEDRNTSRSS
ncbi:MAG: D-aminoacyl-tRNA deacylase [Chloroflexota bacterium]|nr:D-aminoacyl-tRNA deacylase [Chloroflexota bacterium]